ncbi:MAG: hypothetical protein WA123_00665 [Methylotenera sp.]
MMKIRYLLIVLGMLLCSVTSAAVQVGIGIGLPHVSIGINFPAYPELVVVPGYPVYYAPRLQANLFFYDGMYWVYQDDYWYASSWYNGPWWLVEPEYVPVFILRVPVRYYLRPPVYFHGWRRDAPPRWGDHWGHDWDQHRSGWDRWDRRSAPPPAPPPVYQRQYSGDRYPQQLEQQHELHQRNYNYQPQDPVVRQHYQEQAAPRVPVQQERQRAPETDSRQHDIQRSEPPQRQGADTQRSAPSSPQQERPEVQDQRQQPQPGLEPRGQQMPRTPDLQNTPRQQHIPAATREQSPQKGGMSIQRSNPPSSQQERTEVQNRRQQPQQGADRQEQQGTRSQETREQQQDRGRGRNE